jgi:hypothetical protein
VIVVAEIGEHCPAGVVAGVPDLGSDLVLRVAKNDSATALS